MTPPKMQPWNLALRLGLEIAAFVGLGIAAWNQTGAGTQWIAVVAVPTMAAVLWGTFNVLDDPSRSGRAPVEVSGKVRLAVEAFVLGTGWLGYIWAGHLAVGVSFAALTIVHYLVGLPRLRWLLDQRRR